MECDSLLSVCFSLLLVEWESCAPEQHRQESFSVLFRSLEWVGLLDRNQTDQLTNNPPFSSLDVVQSSLDSVKRLSFNELHSQHWTSISQSWRLIYGCSVAFLAAIKSKEISSDLKSQGAEDRFFILKEILREIDVAIIISPPLLRDILNEKAADLHTLLSKLSVGRGREKVAIPSAFDKPISDRKEFGEWLQKSGESVLILNDPPSLSLFYENHYRLSKPAVIKGAISHW